MVDVIYAKTLDKLLNKKWINIQMSIMKHNEVHYINHNI